MCAWSKGVCLENTILSGSLSAEILPIGKGTRLSRAASTILQERLLARKGWRSILLPFLQTSCQQVCHSDAVFWTSGGARSRTLHLAECLDTQRWPLGR